MPGVVDVMGAPDLDLPDLPPPPSLDRPDVTRPLLASDRVRYVGEPLAVVIAETRVLAVDGAELVWPEIDDLPQAPSGGVSEAEPTLFEESNVLGSSALRSETTVREELAVSASVEVHNQRLAPVAIEGLAILCERQGEGGIKVACGHQAPHRLKGQLASALGLDPQDVRVVVPDVGGAFGLKGMFFTEYAVVAAAALRLGRPVMWVESRREHFASGTHGRSQTHRVTLQGDHSGRIRRARIEIKVDVGAYPHNGFRLPYLSRFVATGLYDIDEVAIETTLMVSNRAPVGAYRGAGRPEAAYAIERAVDAFARAAKLDPAEVRQRNLIGDLPYETTTGAKYDSGDYRAALDRALELAEVDAVRAEQRRRLDFGEDPVGVGIGAFVERAGGPSQWGEFAEVELTPSGQVVVRTGSTASGQGHKTVWSQVMAEVLTVDSSQVLVVAGDTDQVTDGVGTFGSRSAQIGASAAYRMARRVREQARARAAGMLEASTEDLRLVDGEFRVAGVPDLGVSLAEVASSAAEEAISLRHSEMFVPGVQTFPYGVHIAVVEVEMETGWVKLRRMITVDDCGHMLNPMIVEGQLRGSLTQGIGQALMEGIEYSESGIPLTSTLMDYLIPTAQDVPPLISDRLVHPAPSNPLGVKGTGEAGCIGAPPAIVNAALDALAPYGVMDLQMPLRPNHVWAAIQNASVL